MRLKAIVDLVDISMNYHSKEGETRAVAGVNLSVEAGEFVSVVGPSGCGKSTILSLIAGLISPTSGHVEVNGRVGYMFQRDQLFPWRTILDNVLLGLEIQKNKSAEAIAYAHEMLEKYGLGDFKNHRPREMSGGMRQRVALIRTLVTRPKILLLDEPFSALDYQTRLSVSDEVGGIIAEEGVTAILVTHDISEAIALSDRVVVLSKRPSRVVSVHKIDFEGECGTPTARRKQPQFPEYFDKIWKEMREDE
ncbi:MAG: ABC transporter ATP-binding protein [Defluviitaleaceae bacterium]|nr:ABC transporter ATP-binding protein [Defluviitaleaceae bacterium]